MRFLLSCFLVVSLTSNAQEKGNRGTIKIEKTSCTLMEGSDTVYVVADKMPEFKGGLKAFNKWMNENMKKQPAEDAQYGGTVFCTFTVNADGTISDILIRKSVSPQLDREALRLLTMMPKWEPGVCNKKEVDVRVNYPITFGVK